MKPLTNNNRIIKSQDLKTSELHTVALGDVHLGHPDTTTEHILNCLRKCFPNNAEQRQIDLFFLEGDIFDRLLDLNDENVHLITRWIHSFLRMCKQRDIVVRVLEGTPSHDWKQSKLFIEVNENSNIGADVKYIDTLSIEYIERFNIHVLYVPDEWRVSCDDTWLEVVQLLKQHNLEQVDFACMHGAFTYQMPTNIQHKLELHDAQRYLSIVKYFIHIGHVHQYHRFDRILPAGSFDRLCHGDESPKGYIYTIVNETKQQAIFIPNEDAMTYLTIDCCGMDSETLLAFVDAKVKELRDDSHVRLKAIKGDAAMSALSILEERYPFIHWKLKEIKSQVEDNKPVMIDFRTEQHTLTLNRDSLKERLLNRVMLKYPALSIDVLSNTLEEVLDD